MASSRRWTTSSTLGGITLALGAVLALQAYRFQATQPRVAAVAPGPFNENESSHEGAGAAFLSASPRGRAPQIPPTSASAATRFGGSTYLLLGGPGQQRLNRSLAHKACASLNGRLATLAPPGGDGGLGDHLADALRNFTHASTLRSAMAGAAADAAASAERLLASDKPLHDTNLVNYGNQPAIQALWWAGAGAAGEPPREGHGAAWSVLDGAYVEGGVNASTRLPYICQVSEPGAGQYSHPDMAALVALARHLLPLQAVANAHADPCQLFAAASQGLSGQRWGIPQPAGGMRDKPLVYCNASGRVVGLQVAAPQLSTTGGMLRAYEPGNGWEARPLEALRHLIVTDPSQALPFDSSFGARPDVRCPSQAGAGAGSPPPVPVAAGAASAGGAWLCSQPWVSTPVPGWLLPQLAPNLEHLAIGGPLPAFTWTSLEADALADDIAAGPLPGPRFVGDEANPFSADLSFPDGLAATACRLGRLRWLHVRPLVELSRAEQLQRRALGLPAVGHGAEAAERLGTELLPACLGELEELRSLQLVHRTELPMQLPASLGKLRRLQQLHISHDGPCHSKARRRAGRAPEDLRTGCGLTPPELRAEQAALDPCGVDVQSCQFARWRFECGCTSGVSAALRGPLPDWSGMESLRRLSLARHNLTGDIPLAWARGGMAALERLHLSGNRLSGDVGEWLAAAAGQQRKGNDTAAAAGSAGLPALAELDLDCNVLHAAKMPNDLSGLRALQELRLKGNRLDSMPRVLPCTLRVLALEHNDIAGELGCFSFPESCAASSMVLDGGTWRSRPVGLTELLLANNRLHGGVLPCLHMPEGQRLSLEHQRAGPVAVDAAARLASACGAAGAAPRRPPSAECVQAADQLRATLSINGALPPRPHQLARHASFGGLALTGRLLAGPGSDEATASERWPLPPGGPRTVLAARQLTGGFDAVLPAKFLANCRGTFPLSSLFTFQATGGELQLQLEHEDQGDGRNPPAPAVLHIPVLQPTQGSKGPQKSDVDLYMEFESQCFLETQQGRSDRYLEALMERSSPSGPSGANETRPPNLTDDSYSLQDAARLAQDDRERQELWKMASLLHEATRSNGSDVGRAARLAAAAPAPRQRRRQRGAEWLLYDDWPPHARQNALGSADVDLNNICIAFRDHTRELTAAALRRSTWLLIAAQPAMLAAAVLAVVATLRRQRRGCLVPGGSDPAPSDSEQGAAEPLLGGGTGLPWGKGQPDGAVQQWLLLQLQPGLLCTLGAVLAVAAALGSAFLPEGVWFGLYATVLHFCMSQWARPPYFQVFAWHVHVALFLALLPAMLVAWRMLCCVHEAAMEVLDDARRRQLKEAEQQLHDLRQQRPAAAACGSSAASGTSAGEAQLLPCAIAFLEPLLQASMAWCAFWGPLLLVLLVMAPVVCIQAAMLPRLPSMLVLKLPLACLAGGRTRVLRLLSWCTAVTASPVLVVAMLYQLDASGQGITNTVDHNMVFKSNEAVPRLRWRLQMVVLCALGHVVAVAAEAALASCTMLMGLSQKQACEAAGLQQQQQQQRQQLRGLGGWQNAIAWLLGAAAAALLAALVVAARGGFESLTAPAALAAALIMLSVVVHVWRFSTCRRCAAAFGDRGSHGLAVGVDGVLAARVDSRTAAAAFEVAPVVKLLAPVAVLLGVLALACATAGLHGYAAGAAQAVPWSPYPYDAFDTFPPPYDDAYATADTSYDDHGYFGL